MSGERMHIPLTLQGITIRYANSKLAVRDLSLEISPGEVFGLVGPNGAGKSSLLNCAAGLIVPHAGGVYAGGQVITGTPRIAARHLVLMPDPLGVYLDITCAEYMEFFARAYKLPASVAGPRIAHAVERAWARAVARERSRVALLRLAAAVGAHPRAHCRCAHRAPRRTRRGA